MTTNKIGTNLTNEMNPKALFTNVSLIQLIKISNKAKPNPTPKIPQKLCPVIVGIEPLMKFGLMQYKASAKKIDITVRYTE
jgi:hypothetical protein